jgi:hypothetical protein
MAKSASVGGVSYTEGIIPDSEAHLIPLKATLHTKPKQTVRKPAIKAAVKRSSKNTSPAASKMKGSCHCF